LGGSTRVNSDAGTLALTAGTGITGSSNLTLGGAGNGSVSGPIATSGSVTKDGSGTWTLSGANTYTGTTSVVAGILNFNGSVTGAGDLTVGTSANTAATANVSGTWTGILAAALMSATMVRASPCSMSLPVLP
jgi:autotransporter-associated beta strand protein